MRVGNENLQAIILSTLTKYPTVEAELPAKVSALRKALSEKTDIEFEPPSESSAGPSSDMSTRRCRTDRSITIDRRGRGIARLRVTLRPPQQHPAELAATLAVWEQDGAWWASIEDGAPVPVDNGVGTLSEQLTSALQQEAREAGIDRTKDRRVYEGR